MKLRKLEGIMQEYSELSREDKILLHRIVSHKEKLKLTDSLDEFLNEVLDTYFYGSESELTKEIRKIRISPEKFAEKE